MSDEWLTYEQVAERLHVTLRAARARAFRGRWSKMEGNDGRARVRLPDEPCAPARSMTVRPTDSALATALREHNDTLKTQLAATEAQLAEANARADKAIAALSTLADEIAKLAEERSRPWWRRIRLTG